MSRIDAEITRPATLDHLPALLAFLDTKVLAAGLGDDALFPVHLAVEEACANVIRHAYPDSPGPLTLRLAITPESVVVTLSDEAPVFDLAQVPRPTLAGTVEERPIGGLGWHFIHALMYDVRHADRPEGGNQLTLVKHRPIDP
ncbi:MAG: ATP-binding protein [Bacteroidota bacterium]